jgi:MATE family multidrug resistance protein
MILSNLSVPLLGLVDAAILGHLDSARYLAAVAVGGTLLSFLYWGFGFLRMGTTGLAAQAFGADQTQQSRLIVMQSMVLGLVIGSLLILFSPLLIKLGLGLITPPPESSQLALTYSQIRLFSAPAVLVNFAIVGWLIGHQQTRWPMVIALFTNGLNILLDFALIIGLKMNSDGAALATLIAEYCGCGLALWVLRRQLRELPGQLAPGALRRWQDYQQLLRVNRHLFVRTLLLLASFAFFTAQGAAQGETVLAANALLIQLLMLTAFGLDGIAHAAEALVGDSVGQRNQARFMIVCKACWQWSALIAVAYSLGFWLFEDGLIALLTSLPAVTAHAHGYYPWLIALPLIAVWSYLLDGIFIGATQSQAMQSSMLASVLLVYLPLWYLFQPLGNHGLWLAFSAFNAARGLSLAAYFYYYSRQQRWW